MNHPLSFNSLSLSLSRKLSQALSTNSLSLQFFLSLSFSLFLSLSLSLSLSPCSHTHTQGGDGTPAVSLAAVSRTDADSRLRGTPEGTFIIRDSSKGGSFVLSVSEGGKVSHYKIDRRSPCVYEIGDESFANLPEIIEFYKRHMLDTTPLSVPLPLEGELVGAELAANYLTEATALYNFNARDPEDLSFRKGEQLFVLEVTEREWWKAQSRATRQIGMVPANYLKTAKNILPDLPADSAPEAPAPEAMAPAAIDPTPPPLASRGPLPPPPAETLAAIDPTPVVTPSLPSREPNNAPARAPASSSVVPSYFYELSKDKLPDRPNFVVCRAKLDRNAKSFDKSALSFKAGDLIHVLHQPKNGLWRGKLVNGDSGKVGHFPFTLVELVDAGVYDDELNAMKKVFVEEMDAIYGTA
ncbi:uncharacterized protein MONBRDRAFT_25437 [Monosiga brevicollis MX1]|uniref:SH3 domain-containing protein n=1 Tax=Monosiga brevicollis TaxID=81824 RepID=A9UZF3_MONBE|nr:uncharacterized protein MONBRDRAFT_25437 [Monosiga brevicollis MX1]EDQ89222.1 predicted protein [Monosiga brevicollis MX1]|eukprot:XP_001745798.1 hypothetical protein [Monosiga brevicollis MX1]